MSTADLARIHDLCTNTGHFDQAAGLQLALTAAKSLKESGGLSGMRDVVPDVVRHVERSGYPAVVGPALEVLKVMATDSTLSEELRRYNFVTRVIATLEHQHADVKVACAVFLAQLAKDTQYHDTIALQRGYHALVHLVNSEDERVQLAALVALRVLLAVDSNVSDFARANGFATLFRMLRGQLKAASPKVLAQAMVVLRLAGANRTVAIEIKSAHLESDIAAHLSNTDAAVQLRTLEALNAILDDDAGRKFSIQNGKLDATLTAYRALTNDAEAKAATDDALRKLKH